MKHLALCHTVVIDPKNGNYNAASPDELAIINGAKTIGALFTSRDENNVVTIRLQTSGQEFQFAHLATCEFSSSRKRRTVILQNLQTGEYILLSKGADSVMFPRLSEKAKASETVAVTKGFCDEFAREGLRTLILGERLMSKSEVDTYLAEH